MGRWPPDLVAVPSLLALALSSVIGTGDALAAFGNPTVVMIAALFVVGEALSRTGVTGWGGQRLLAAAQGSKIRLLVVVMAGTGGYRFMDYVKVGLPLMLLFLAVSLVLVPVFWPL